MEDFTVSYCDHTSILIVNTMGRMRRLYTPFRVTCKEDYMGLKKGTSIYVDEVSTNLHDDLLYVTSLGVFAHSHFAIVASF
ncbi:MAG: hypothetical protein JNM41_13470 [Flavipsychrobacter sp.]|nr:hypothetical protein [Flavipsychrobacter sp.]